MTSLDQRLADLERRLQRIADALGALPLPPKQAPVEARLTLVVDNATRKVA